MAAPVIDSREGREGVGWVSYWARVRMTKYGDDMTGRWRQGSEGNTRVARGEEQVGKQSMEGE